MEILSIGRISQTRKIAALCGKEGKIVMKKKKSEFGAYAIGWLYLLAPVIILAVGAAFPTILLPASHQNAALVFPLHSLSPPGESSCFSLISQNVP